ncbi:MAG: DUF4290 domain-containing protein [Bacteroidales bacterium]|nr:DUF4290 domain-containing protein [Bacteroidales bacterium]
MEYNTQRQTLKITDYGRVVAKMIDYARTIADREERTHAAHTIVEVMAQVNPKVKERTDYRHILWDHLMLLADYSLDVDCPYELHPTESVTPKPRQLTYHNGQIRYRHYGQTLEAMVKAVAELPESEERTRLTEQIAHMMKRQYLQWNRDTVDDQLLRDQLEELSGGRLRLAEGFSFHDTQFYGENLGTGAAKKESTARKRRKKKK